MSQASAFKAPTPQPRASTAREHALHPEINQAHVRFIGLGKTYLALAAALYMVLERKLYDKVFVVKPTIEIGAKLGFLPGDIAGVLPAERKHETPPQAAGNETPNLKNLQRRQIAEVLAKTGSKKEAAQILGISKTTLWRKCRELGLE